MNDPIRSALSGQKHRRFAKASPHDHGVGLFAANCLLNAEERTALQGAISDFRDLARGECIHQQGARHQGLSILCQGVAHAVRVMADGRQQILAIFVPGDAMDCQPIARPAASRLCAITAAQVATIKPADLADLMQLYPSIVSALWRETARHAAIQQEWLVSLGRQNSHARMAHFICEVWTRFSAAGLAETDVCPFPLTQSDIADALGISAVHANRMLQQLRQEGLVALSSGALHIIDRTGLHEAASFDPSYLGLDGR